MEQGSRSSRLLGVALVFGLVNAIIKPILILFTLPALLLTLGAIVFVLITLGLITVVLDDQTGFIPADDKVSPNMCTTALRTLTSSFPSRRRARTCLFLSLVRRRRRRLRRRGIWAGRSAGASVACCESRSSGNSA